MLRTIGNEIRLTSGDTYIFTVPIQYFDDSEYVMKPCDIVEFTAKKNIWDEEPAIHKIFPSNNIVLDSVDTQNLIGDYYYDVKLKSASGLVITVIPVSKFVILPSVGD